MSIKLTPFALALILLFPLTSSAQYGSDYDVTKSPDWTSLPDALKEASALDSKIMVFVYTEWCGYCRRMIQETFQDDNVLGYLGEEFQSVLINAESTEEVDLDGQVVTEAQLAQALGVSGFPTIIFMEPTGKYITRLPGYLEPSDYMCVLSYIGSDSYETVSYGEHLESCSG